MDKKKSEEVIRLLRQLVSDIQGAPYPSENFEQELYSIWYEHIQRNAQNCFEFLNANFPVKPDPEVNKTIKKMFK